MYRVFLNSSDKFKYLKTNEEMTKRKTKFDPNLTWKKFPEKIFKLAKPKI